MPPVGFEPMIPASARPQTYALDRAAAGIGAEYFLEQKYETKVNWMNDRVFTHFSRK
jgi:hypothetical protein